MLTGPRHTLGAAGHPACAAADSYDMVPVRLEQSPLTATAGLVWNGDLPRQLQQVLFDTADGIAH